MILSYTAIRRGMVLVIYHLKNKTSIVYIFISYWDTYCMYDIHIYRKVVKHLNDPTSLYSTYFTVLLKICIYGAIFPLQKCFNTHITDNTFLTHSKKGDSRRMQGDFSGSGNNLQFEINSLLHHHHAVDL